jgi:hypothetical protein
MKYQIGDDIVVLHSMEEGKVVELINDKLIMIEVRGVRFPAYQDQIDFPYFHRFTKHLKADQPKPAAKPAKQYIDQVRPEKNVQKFKVANGFFLLLLPVYDKDIFEDDVVEKFKLYLVNQTDQEYHFHYKINYDQTVEFELKNKIRKLQDFYLHDVPFEDFNDNPHFSLVVELDPPAKTKAPFFEFHYRPKGKQLFANIAAMQQKQESFFTVLAFENYPDKTFDDVFDLSKLNKAGYKVFDAKEAKKHLPPARTLIDLHIEKIDHNWEQLSPQQIIDTQLAEFDKYLELAILNKLPSFIVIHGIGTGVLRKEIHDKLKLRKEVKTFVNQYDARFGYGATEIFFNQ